MRQRPNVSVRARQPTDAKVRHLDKAGTAEPTGSARARPLSSAQRREHNHVGSSCFVLSSDDAVCGLPSSISGEIMSCGLLCNPPDHRVACWAWGHLERRGAEGASGRSGGTARPCQGGRWCVCAHLCVCHPLLGTEVCWQGSARPGGSGTVRYEDEQRTDDTGYTHLPGPGTPPPAISRANRHHATKAIRLPLLSIWALGVRARHHHADDGPSFCQGAGAELS